MDGFDDYLASAATLNLSTTDKVTVIVGVLKVSDAVASVVAEHSANTNTTDGAFYVTAPHTAAANYGASTRGTITNTSGAAPASFAAGTPRVVTLVANNGGGTQANILKIRVNSVAQTLAFTGTTSAGNYGNLTSYLGSRAGTSAFFNGGIYQYVIFPRNLNASELALAERFVGSKMGIAL